MACDPSSMFEYLVINGHLLYRGKIWLKPDSRFKPMLKEYHETLIGAHVGVVKALKSLLANV